MTVIPCEKHRWLSAELEKLIQQTTTPEELTSFRADVVRLAREADACPDCERVPPPLGVVCGQKGCAALATSRFFWPGAGWRRACTPHALHAVAVGDALGFSVIVEPLK
jgi:hypothetical protein